MKGEDADDRRSDELTGDIGAPDVETMRAIRGVFVENEPLVTEAQFDSVLDPTELRIQFEDGIGAADQCRLEVTWYRSGAYRFHYVDSEGVNWRFDDHPNSHSPDRHFHEPPDAPTKTAAESCITVEEPPLVARAVWKLWRRAYDRGDFESLNTASNPP